MSYRGDPIHGEVISADASGGVAFTLYPAGGTAARALTATEFLIITDIVLVSTAGGVYAVVMDSAAAGKYVVKGNAEALGGVAHSFGTPIVCPKGVTPKVIAAAGQIDVILTGHITQV